MLEKTGIPTSDNLKKVKPGQKRLKEGPVAVIECFREIPCDPCYYSCPFNAIKEFEDINDIPELNEELCTGCGQCISSCPGLAIFVIDYKKGYLSIPYEFLPLPKKGETVQGLNREGKKICQAEVVRVKNSQKNDKTAVITIKILKKHLMKVRNIKVGEDNE